MLETHDQVALLVQNTEVEIITKDGRGSQIDLVLNIMETNTTDTVRHDKLTKFLNTRWCKELLAIQCRRVRVQPL